jgi:NADH:flavin oxidoreductases, Old Yellow Enzyme family
MAPRRGRALAWRHQDPQSRQPRSQPLALGRAQPLSLSPADPRHGQGRYPRLPALAGQCRAARPKQAGFDIVYCYAGHGYLPFQFISPRWNRRSDEYGGAIANRARLLREMIEVTKEAVGERCAVAVRLAMDELLGEEGVTFEREGREVVSLLAELPDLWDVNISYVENDSMSARFSEEGSRSAMWRR